MNTVIFLAVFAVSTGHPAMHIPSLAFETTAECENYQKRFERNAKRAGFQVRTYCRNGGGEK